jgi:hypothetical protein
MNDGQALPASHDYMLAFIYLAYSVMILHCETVPVFEHSCLDRCLGDLGRYTTAIEDDDTRDHEAPASIRRHGNPSK